jgi:phenylalanyl-tRNA synthetase beta chain
MLTMLAHNLNRDVREARLFEQGQIFTGTPATGTSYIAEVHEIPQLSLGVTTASSSTTRLYPATDAPIFELKGVIESLVSLFTPPGGSAALSFTTANTPAWLEPGRSAVALLDNQPLAHFGELASTERESRKLRQPVYLAQINLSRLYDLPLKRVTARELSRFQAVERDFSFVMPDSVQWHAIASAVDALVIPELQSRQPIEIWRDAKKFPGVYSLLLRTVFQSHDRTLRDEEITAWSTRIIGALTKLGGTQRV